MNTRYFIADADLAATFVEEGPSQADAPTVELDRFEPDVLPGVLWGIIEAGTIEFDPRRFDTWTDTVMCSVDELSDVGLLAAGFVRALAGLPDDRVPAVAALWATSDEWLTIDGERPGDLTGTVRALRDLARRAEAAGQPLYVWHSSF